MSHWYHAYTQLEGRGLPEVGYKTQGFDTLFAVDLAAEAVDNAGSLGLRAANFRDSVFVLNLEIAVRSLTRS